MFHVFPRRVALFLKSIEITGFKSFARMTRLELPAGITALVGANGSGKSNIVDAVRWCLGEQSVRDLRAQRSDEVIYAGPRRVVGVAEVALTFEEVDGRTEPRPAELGIARRLYRSGESEYLVNRARVRLRDVLAALHHVGIDSGRHVVVTQGMADALLSASPLERRSLLEQAAGLSAYRESRDDARQKLATTWRNLETIEAVLAELEPRVRLLRRQARAVEEREEAGRRLRIRLLDWYSARWMGATQAVTALQAEARVLAGRRKELVDEVARLEDEAERSLERERAWHGTLQRHMDLVHAAERERDAGRREVDGLERRLSAAQQAAQELVRHLADLATTRSETQERLAVVGRSLRVLEAEREDQERAVTQLQSRLELLQGELEQRTRAASAARAAFLEAERVEWELNRQRLEMHSRFESQKARLEESERRIADMHAEVRDLERQATQAEEEASAARERERRWETGVLALGERVAAGQSRLQRLDRLHHKLRSLVAECEARQTRGERLLTTMDREIGPNLMQRLSVASGWEQAIAATLGAWAGAPLEGGARLVPRHADLGGFLEWRAALEPDGWGQGVWADALVCGLPDHLVTPLAGTLLVESDADAERLWRHLAPMAGHAVGSPPLRVVTRDGACWSAFGIERMQDDDRAARYLILKAELARLSRQRGVQGRRLESVKRAHAVSTERADRLIADLRAAQGHVERARGERKRAETLMERLIRHKQSLAAEQDSQISALKGLRSTLLELEATLREGDRRLDQARRSRAAAAERHEESGSAEDELRQECSTVVEEAEATRRRLEVLRAKESAQGEILTSLRRDVARVDHEEAAALERRRGLAEETSGLVSALQEARTRLATMDAAVEARCRELGNAQEQRPMGDGPGNVLRTARVRVAEVIAQHERVLAHLGQAEADRDQLRAAMTAELGIGPDELPPAVLEPPDESEIRRLRSRAMQYADAEPSVIEEYRQLEERGQRLRKHLEDLRAAGDDLKEIMTVADREMQQRFRGALTAVSEEFSRVCRIMLQGGDARLEQIDDEGGIEIRAQLPGRRARSSAAFSGGERSLIASSLLFGVLKIRPTPFCILDEVDAALDETNVERYLTVLRDVSRDTQMIVVTHNRATMAAADVLYGLTMDDEGGSSVLSLRLDAYDAAG